MSTTWAQTHGYTEPKKQVSALMSRIRSKDTVPEMVVRRYLHASGFRYKLHCKGMPGKPDIVLPKYNTVIIVQGCFWHLHGKGCGIKARTPHTNTSYWGPKLQRNVLRDEASRVALEQAGWQVLIVWECELKLGARGATLHRLSSDILRACEHKLYA